MLDELLDAVDGIAYAVDAEHRIVAVGRRRWDRFAAETGAPHLCADKIIGRNLFELVIGSEAPQACRDLAAGIVASGAPVVVNARCDTPDIGRELRLSVAPLHLGDKRPGLLVQARIVGETARPDLDVSDFKVLLDALMRLADLPIVTMCSFCQQVRRPGPDGDEDWVAAEECYRLGGTSRVRISHGLCADCDAVRFPDL